MTSTQKPKPRLYTVSHELRRYGLRRTNIALWLLWAVMAAALSRYVPHGQGKDVFQYLTFHFALLGFGATVFGFTILGGKDDFFEPIMDSVPEGLSILRDMVLFLFFPLILHVIACGLLCLRILFPSICSTPWCFYPWRGLYAFFAIWGFFQSAMSFRFLFILAITRLVWKDKQMKAAKNKSEAASGVKDERDE